MDQLDRAKQVEMDERQRSLDAQKARAVETEDPCEIDGVRYCVDCGIEILKKRLEARPESVRCIDCKTIKERKDAQYA